MRNQNTVLAFSNRTATVARWPRIWQRFVQPVWIALSDALRYATVQAHEPRIHQIRDRQGQTLWQVFDPVSRDRATFACEREVRAWLEQRYYLD